MCIQNCEAEEGCRKKSAQMQTMTNIISKGEQ